MRILRNLKEAEGLIPASVVTLGNFDGVHRGHQELLHLVLEEGIRRKIPTSVLTFYPHPLEILQPDREFQRIFPWEDQIEQMKMRGLDFFIQHPFSIEFSQLSPGEFLNDWLFPCLRPQVVVVGYDFAFGAKRQGSLRLLQNEAEKLKVEVKVIPPFQIQNQIVSSSKIREFIRRGEMNSTQEFLGRNFYLTGRVIRGDQRGRTIGFPTANLDVEWNLKPRVGVYLTRVSWRGKDFPAMTNVGWNPTVTEVREALKIETHILDFDEEIYGQKLKVTFLEFLREEKKFSSLEELKRQLNSDRDSTRKAFEEKKYE